MKKFLAAGIPYWGPIVSCTGLGCNSLCDLLKTFQNFIYFIITLAVFAIGPILIIWGGIVILTAAGGERLAYGKRIIYGTLIGILIALASFAIVNTILWAIGQPTGSTGGSWSNFQCSVAPSSGGGQFQQQQQQQQQSQAPTQGIIPCGDKQCRPPEICVKTPFGNSTIYECKDNTNYTCGDLSLKESGTCPPPKTCAKVPGWTAYKCQ